VDFNTLSGSLKCSSVFKRIVVTYILYTSLIYRDLKPANVLIGGDGHCKMADFGLSALGIFPGDKTSGSVDTVYYMAPEVIMMFYFKSVYFIF
jgi:serine/threonine protein kinase